MLFKFQWDHWFFLVGSPSLVRQDCEPGVRKVWIIAAFVVVVLFWHCI